jgi:hypothetical protein
VTTVPRRELLAYLIGAGVAGTILIGPYTGRAVVTLLAPQSLPLTYVPFFLLPLLWGVWNWLHVRLRLRLGAGGWGAYLGLLLALGVNALLAAEARWFTGALLLPIAIPALYYLLWAFIVGPLNEGLGVETDMAAPTAARSRDDGP